MTSQLLRILSERVSINVTLRQAIPHAIYVGDAKIEVGNECLFVLGFWELTGLVLEL
jgi:hypothetical protein